MNRRSARALGLLTAVLLSILAEASLLVPERMSALINGLAPFWQAIAGVAGLISGMAVIAALLSGPSKRQWLAWLPVAVMTSLAVIGYAIPGMWPQAGWMGLLTIGQLMIAHEQRTGRPLLHDHTIAFAGLASLSGAGLLWLPSALPPDTADWWLPTLTVLSLVGTVTAVYAYRTTDGARRRLSTQLSALPWLGWAVLAVSPLDLPRLLPALLIAALLISADLIPWTKLTLPPEDLIGRRFLFTSNLGILAIVLAMSWVLGHSQTLSGADPDLQQLIRQSRDLLFVLALAISAFEFYMIVAVCMTINSLVADLSEWEETDLPASTAEETVPWARRAITRWLKPFATTRLITQARLQDERIRSLSSQAQTARRRIAQIELISELSMQLETRLDQPVASQLAVTALQRALECNLVSLLLYDPEQHEFTALAAAGPAMRSIPPGYRQSMNTGLIGRAARVRKTQVSNDTRADRDYLQLEDEQFLSEVVVPLFDHGHLKGAIVADSTQPQAFGNHDVTLLEGAAAELLRAWERSDYHQRLTDLIQAGVTLSTTLDPQSAIQEIAAIARQTLQARFTFVTLLDQFDNFTRSANAGNAPTLIQSLSDHPREDSLINMALNAPGPFRVRDLRQQRQASHLRLDHDGLRSLLAIPIRVRRLSIGVILAFGRQGEVSFTENDESLANLISSQAAAAIEAAWLYRELNTTLNTTTQLYQLSYRVTQAEELTDAASAVAETAYKLTGASVAGIVLFNMNDQIEARVEIDAGGIRAGERHPLEMIQSSMARGESIILAGDSENTRLCFPLQTPRRKYGALWLDIPEANWNQGRTSANLRTLTNQAAIALERAILLAETRQQAAEIQAAYRELQITYDQTLAALMSALDARDRETEGHSVRVGLLASRLGEQLGLTAMQAKALERGAMLHDIGKIGVSDAILHKPGPLTEVEWDAMRLHPNIGARIVADVPFLRDTLGVIRSHQERWDGSGYPDGLRGKDIPLEARIFAVADAYDALTSSRPYREKSSPREALQYLREQANILFDPDVVAAFELMFNNHEIDDLLEEE